MGVGACLEEVGFEAQGLALLAVLSSIQMWANSLLFLLLQLQLTLTTVTSSPWWTVNSDSEPK